MYFPFYWCIFPKATPIFLLHSFLGRPNSLAGISRTVWSLLLDPNALSTVETRMLFVCCPFYSSRDCGCTMCNKLGRRCDRSTVVNLLWRKRQKEGSTVKMTYDVILQWCPGTLVAHSSLSRTSCTTSIDGTEVYTESRHAFSEHQRQPSCWSGERVS